MEILKSQSTPEDIARSIIQENVDFDIESIKNISSGAVGHVFVVSAERNEQKLVVKLGEDEEEYPFDREPNDNRVYGVRWSNLWPSHNLLKSHHIAVPTLHLVGQIEDKNLHYVIMDLAEGESIREYLSKENSDDTDELHALVGEVFGRMHSITREFQGWVDMPKPYSKRWREAFFDSLQSHLLRAADKNQFIKKNLEALKSFAKQKQDLWVDPSNFVFSHTDGFQGVAKHENKRWEFTGVVDIEDNQFTDQRFVLTGYELALNKKAPESFWREYTKYISVPESYESHKSLFKMFYLLSWLPGHYNNDKVITGDNLKKIQDLENGIEEILQN